MWLAMASRKADELPGDTKDLAAISRSLSRCSPDDITEEPQSDAVNATVKSQKSGRFRRTALTFFGVRKGICILPSFFGGRSKNQNKWSSKKGLTKSKTHDGLSKVSHDDGVRGRYTSAGDSICHCQGDCSGELHTLCHNECSHPTAEQKSLTLGRQRKGFRSLFHSFKHHRNHRNSGTDKTEMIPMSSPHCKKEVPVVQDNTNMFVTSCLGSEPDVPDFTDDMCDVSIGPDCSDADAVTLEKSVEQESPKSEFDDQVCDVQIEEINLMAVVSSDYQETSPGHSEPCLKVQMTSEPVLKSETPAGSSDRLNLMFGDVASLKSFDSLTGCGDIIADQEDDSITESTVSGERSRNGGKRASCYLTYQGGGEEMASPEDLGEECLHDFWGNNAVEKICYTCNEDHTDMTAELTSSHNMDCNSNSLQQASGMDTSSIADVLTPQSEHQESVPNSDEGYYDSTTPGPEEGQEKSDRLRTDRLPRDSYSGDALYELFAPDESLISPHYENKSKLPGSKQCKYLSEPADVSDSAFVPDMDRLQISAELYEVHNFLGSSKSSELAQSVDGRREMGLNKDCNLNSKPQASGNRNNIEPNVFDDKGNMLASAEERQKSINADCEKRHSSISFGSTSDPDFETFCEPKEQHLEENKPVALPYKNITCQSPDCNNDLDDGQTVCFSQALVDYTKHSQMLSNLHNSVDGLETNSAFTTNMDALPTIVTFDVVDMHNEGEYDEQIHMELEEDISSPYQEFEESYLQKDAFAEFDYQMLDMYEQNLISSTWAIASLPRHLGLTRVSQSMSNPLSLDRRSRSLDTGSLEMKMPDAYREEIAAIVSSPQTEEDSDRDSSPHYKKNVHASASDVKDCSSIMALSWQTRSGMALSHPLTHGEISEKVQGVSQTHGNHKLFSTSSGSDFPDCKLQRLGSSVSDGGSCDSLSHNSKLYNRQCHVPLHSDSCLPHSTFVYPGMVEEESEDVDDDVFCKAATNFQPYNQCGKSRPVAHREGLSHTGSPINAGVSKEEMAVRGETRTPRDLACGKLPETTFN
ncbi:APC membrane recruitment protein 1 [Scophthalmus maximus]|uniref:APC membrane recruitment protein 1 n=1 Tax=Scophthalmus maximus TaxID=52904 RepID=UPI001FA82348|nr:APC membrane recruitment protein 1 [Scophthalmus maximus]XP_035481248.2 APC membrane recruitment protein 1 [Scophthalmus maximus]XP_035481249.2 APC membrane recruitment protein 1 [Scophthalmus maximus]